jgi:hypothetical protein
MRSGMAQCEFGGHSVKVKTFALVLAKRTGKSKRNAAVQK